jgi:hypothetical protein
VPTRQVDIVDLVAKYKAEAHSFLSRRRPMEDIQFEAPVAMAEDSPRDRADSRPARHLCVHAGASSDTIAGTWIHHERRDHGQRILIQPSDALFWREEELVTEPGREYAALQRARRILIPGMAVRRQAPWWPI